MKNVLLPLTKNVLMPLGLAAVASAGDASIHKKHYWIRDNNTDYFKKINR